MTTFLDFPGLRDRLSREPRFALQFLAMAERLGLDPDSILSVMSIETANTFDPAVQNPTNPDPNKRATGLIQFMPTTAQSLGTTIPALRQMTAVEQLQYVERYFERVKNQIRRDVPGDYYMAVFMPAFIGAAPDTVLGRKDDPGTIKGLSLAKVYEQNPGFDRQHRGFFTVQDVWNTTLGRIADARRRPPIEVTAASPLAAAAAAEASSASSQVSASQAASCGPRSGSRGGDS